MADLYNSLSAYPILTTIDVLLATDRANKNVFNRLNTSMPTYGSCTCSRMTRTSSLVTSLEL